MAKLSNTPESTLVTSDGKKFPLTAAIRAQSEMLTLLLENTEITTEVSLHNDVSSSAMPLISEFCEWLAEVQAKSDKKGKSLQKINRRKTGDELLKEDDKEKVDPYEEKLVPLTKAQRQVWLGKLMELDRTELFTLTNSAHGLQMHTLVDIAGQAIAKKFIKGKLPEEIRETFGEPDDLTKKEKEEIMKDLRGLK